LYEKQTHSKTLYRALDFKKNHWANITGLMNCTKVCITIISKSSMPVKADEKDICG
jgi:hypothetical protein